jgi:hypothetical protein
MTEYKAKSADLSFEIFNLLHFYYRVNFSRENAKFVCQFQVSDQTVHIMAFSRFDFMRNGIIKLSFLIQESYTIRSFALEIL